MKLLHWTELRVAQQDQVSPDPLVHLGVMSVGSRSKQPRNASLSSRARLRLEDVFFPESHLTRASGHSWGLQFKSVTTELLFQHPNYYLCALINTVGKFKILNFLFFFLLKWGHFKWSIMDIKWNKTFNDYEFSHLHFPAAQTSDKLTKRAQKWWCRTDFT